jgi:hypothetical protein
MKATSLQNPFANIIAQGYKTIETRTARSAVAKTLYRGEMLICSSGRPHQQWEYIKQHYMYSMADVPLDPFLKLVTDKIWKECHQSVQAFQNRLMIPMKEPSIVAIVELVAVKDMTAEDQVPACYSLFPEAKALMLENVKQVEPIAIKGLTNGFHLGVFEVNIDKSKLIIV